MVLIAWGRGHTQYFPDKAGLRGCLHSLDWTTGLEYWTEVFSFLDKILWFLVYFKYLTSGDLKQNYSISVILQCQQYNDFMTVVVLLAFSNALANKVMIMTLFDQI